MQKKILSHASSSQVGHFLIFFSPDIQVANDLAEKFLAQRFQTRLPHPDIFTYKPSGKIGLHPIASMKTLLENLFLSAHASSQKAFLVQSLERMLPSTANALLKGLEEPPPRTIIVGTTAAENLVLKTIRSRAQIVRIPSEPKAPSEEALSLAEMFFLQPYESVQKQLEKIRAEVEKQLAFDSKKNLDNEQKKSSELSSVMKQELMLEEEAYTAQALSFFAKELLHDLYRALRAKIPPKKLLPIIIKAIECIDAGLDMAQAVLFVLTAINEGGGCGCGCGALPHAPSKGMSPL